MANPKKVYCLFEQSGTFKNQFKSFGIDAEDYDILNDFGQTDHVVDLYQEIRNGYGGGTSIFDQVEKDDLIMAFFPCIRFENEIMLWFRGQSASQKTWSDERKMQNCMKLLDELNENYKLVNQMFIICKRKGLKLIMENPYSEEHFLRRYWCIPASVIDKDRRERGDYYAKPTQYWFVNLEPQYNIVWNNSKDNSFGTKDAIRMITKKDYEKIGAKNVRVARSMIHPDYANRFIKEFILDGEKEAESQTKLF